MHHAYIQRCLDIAQEGRGRTGINPMVGAVLVRGGNIIAEALHEEFGGLHAEAFLIKKFDQKIQQEDRLYVNLEPCCHTNKKTLPCTEAIINSGIKHLVIGMLDPNALVVGKGIAELRKHGIEVTGPIERARCEWFNRGFVSVMTKGRPWITLKKAQTISGAIAHDDGSKMKITDSEQDAWSHQHLRARHDAILVGVGTVISDDPMLTCRMKNEELRMKNYQPLRIVLDPHFRIPSSAKIVSGEMAGGTIIVRKDANHSEDSKDKMQILLQRGVRSISIPLDASAQFNMHALFRALTTPTNDFHGITSILVEGGKKTWEVFAKANAVDCMTTLVGRSKDT